VSLCGSFLFNQLAFELEASIWIYPLRITATVTSGEWKTTLREDQPRARARLRRLYENFLAGDKLGCSKMQTLLQMPTSPECPERRRLAHEVAETVALVFELKKRQREASKKHEGLSILF